MNNNLNNKWKLSQLTPLVQKDNSDYEYGEQELIQYAQHIGIQLPEQSYMFDLAKQGIKENLPQGWKAFLTPSSDIVYRNMESGQIIDEHPLDEQYRLRVIMIRQEKLLQDQQQSQYSQSASLSQIAEDQNQIENDSQVYERKKPSIPRQSNLRQPLTKEGMKLINQTHKRQISKLSQNSIIQKSLQQKSVTSSNNAYNNNKQRPFSSLLQNYKGSQKPLSKQHGGQFTQKEDQSKQSQSNSSLGDQLRDQINRVKELKQKLRELQQQQKLKLSLLDNLQKSNNRLMQKICKRIKRREKRPNKI